jgi:hypothetical protein
LNALLAECLRRGTGELRLFENNDEIVLRHGSNSLLLSVQLTPLRPDKSLLMTWLRVGEVSLDHFQGALAQAPASGALWLMHCLHDKHDEQRLQRCLESLLNQRDTWRAFTERRLNAPPPPYVRCCTNQRSLYA